MGLFTSLYIWHVLTIYVAISWVEEDPKEIMQSVYECIERTCEKLHQLKIDISNIKGGSGDWFCDRTPKRTRNWPWATPYREEWVEDGGFIDIYVVAFLSAVGVTNQRETTLVWDKETGEPLYNAIGGLIVHLSEQVSL